MLWMMARTIKKALAVVTNGKVPFSHSLDISNEC